MELAGSEMNLQLSNLPSEFGSRVYALSSREKSIHDLSQSLRPKIAEMQNRSDTLQRYAQNLVALGKKIAAEKQEWDARVNRQLKDISNEELKLQCEIENRSIKAQKLVKTIASKRKEIAATKQRVEDSLTHFETFSAQMNKRMSKLQKNLNFYSMSAIRDEIEATFAMKDDVKSHQRQLVTRIESHSLEMKRLSQSLEIAKTQERMLRQKAKETATQHKKALVDLATQLAASQHTRKSMKAKKSELRREKAILIAKIQDSQTCINEVSKTWRLLSRRIRKIQDENTDLSQDLKTSNATRIHLIQGVTQGGVKHSVDGTQRRLKNRHQMAVSQLDLVRAERDAILVEKAKTDQRLECNWATLESLGHQIVSINLEEDDPMTVFESQIRMLEASIRTEISKWRCSNSQPRELIVKWRDSLEYFTEENDKAVTKCY